MISERRYLPLLVLAAFSAVTPTSAQPEENTVRRVMVWHGADDQTVKITETLGSRTYLGVTTVDLTPQLRRHFGAPGERGVLLASILEESPAERAGLAIGDVLTSISGKPISSSIGLAMSIAGSEAGEEVEIELVRDGVAHSLSAVLEEHERGRFDLGPLLTDRIFDGGEALVHLPLGEASLAPLDRERIEEVVVDVRRQFESPLVLRQLEELRSERGELYEKLKLMESRLAELEAEIARLNRER